MQPSPQILFTQIRGTINPASSDYLETAIRRAESLNAQAVVVELDTPGGLLTSTHSMAQAIDNSSVPVVVYVTPGGASATSAGALLTIASHVAAMAPGSHIGAAHPVDSGGKDIEGAMKEKALNDTVAFSKGLAEIRGRNQQLAELVVSKSKSFTASEAKNQGLVEILAANREELLKSLDGRKVKLKKGGERIIRTEGASVQDLEMNWGQKLLSFLANPNIATMLITIGMLCIYVELSSPGIGVAGGLGVICLIVAFISFQMLPIYTGGLVLLLLGIGLFIGEAFASTHGAMAVGGSIALLLGMLWMIDPAQSSLRISPAIYIPVVLLLGGGALGVAYFASRIKRQVQAAREAIGGGDQAGLAGYVGIIQSGGKILIRGELWDFDPVDGLSVGDSAQVIQVTGMRVQVKKV